MKSASSVNHRIVTRAWAYLLVGLTVVTPVYAANPKPPPGSVFVTSTNRPDFLTLGRSGTNKVLCRIRNVKNGIPAVGFVTKDSRTRRQVWKSLDRSISDLRKSRLSSKARKAQIAKLQKVKNKFIPICMGLISTPTPPATPTVLVTGTVTPTATGTPVATATPTGTATATPTITVSAAPSAASILQDAGGPRPPFTPTPDSLGRLWSSDDQNIVQSTGLYRAPPQVQITGTYPAEILRTQRYGNSITYHIPINDNTWDIVMFFAEVNAGPEGTTITGPGQRVFDIKVEGQTVLSGVDIWQLAGGPNTQYSITIPNVVMSDDNLDVELVTTAGAPAALAVFEIRDPGGTIPHTTGTNFGFEVGADGNNYTDPVAGITWQDDSPWVTGNSRQFSDFSIPIAGTNDSFLYQTETYMRLGVPLSYRYILPNRTYAVSLGFAEISPGVTAGQRIFDVQFEGSAVEPNVDIAAQAGPYTALDKNYAVAVADGVLNISLVPVLGNPFVSTIKIDPLNLGLSPTFHDFGTIAGGSQSAPLTVMIRNDSAQVIVVNSVSVGGADAASFLLTATPPFVLAQGGQASVQVVYARPVSATGNERATLQIQTDDTSAAGGLYEVGLSGN